MANKRKPDNVHLLSGTHRKDRHGDPREKPKVAGSITATPPEWLPEAAKVEWKRVVKLMAESGVLTSADTSTLCQYCMLFSELQTDQEEFPAARHTQLRLCAVELGLTPSARSRIIAPSSGKSEPEF